MAQKSQTGKSTPDAHRLVEERKYRETKDPSGPILKMLVHIPIENRGYISVQTTDIEQEIRIFVADTFLLGSSETLNDDTPLLGNIIDSTGVIQLIMFVQERFAITVEDEEAMTDNFGSVKTVVAFIEKKLLSKG